MRSQSLYLLGFFFLYFIFNSSLYITDHILYQEVQSFWPQNHLLLEDSTLVPLDPLYADSVKLAAEKTNVLEAKSENSLTLPHPFWLRSSHDIFKLNAELWIWLLLILLSAHWPKTQKIIQWIGYPLFMFLLIYHVYYFSMVRIYATHPYIPNHLVMAYEVLPIFLGQITFGSSLIYVFGALGFLLTFVLFAFLTKKLSHFSRKFDRKQRMIAFSLFLFLGLCITYSSSRSYSQDFKQFKRDYLSFQWAYPQIQESIVPQGIHKTVDRIRTFPYLSYFNQELERKPDVYLLCIESYGQVLTADPRFSKLFYPALQRTDSLLQKEGWSIASAYSLSPIAGGGSWLAFTSAMTGLRVEDQLRFKDLTSIDFDYPHMINFFNDQDYSTVRLKTMQKTAASTDSSYSVIDAFFEFDHWLKFPNFPYTGYMYNYFGGIPDQFALNFHQETVINANPRPVFTFFISMVSHGPWFLPPPITEDWRDLNAITSNPDPRAPADAIVWKRYEDLLPGGMPDRFPETIDHELRILEDFITKRIDSNSIVILLGDHQPGMITNYDTYGLETILHVISKDRNLIERFWEDGLDEGMIIDPENSFHMRHEGLYSLFMKNFLAQYGNDMDELPYLPEGI